MFMWDDGFHYTFDHDSMVFEQIEDDMIVLDPVDDDDGADGDDKAGDEDAKKGDDDKDDGKKDGGGDDKDGGGDKKRRRLIPAR